MSGLGETTCRGAPVAASGRVLRARSRGASGRIAASVVLRTRTTARAGSVVRRCAVVGASCGNTGSSPGFFQPGHGDSVATPLTRGRGDEGPVGDGSGGARHHGVVRGSTTVGRNVHRLPRARVGRRRASALPVRSRNLRGLPRPTPTRTVRLPFRGERLGVLGASADGRRAFGSRGRRRERRAGPRRETRCGCRARCGGGHGYARTERFTLRGPSGPFGAGHPVRLSSRDRSIPAGFGPTGRVGRNGAFRGKASRRAGAVATPRSHPSIRQSVFQGLAWTQRSRVAADVVPIVRSSKSRGFAPGAEATTA